jgi:hypothetical protein
MSRNENERGCAKGVEMRRSGCRGWDPLGTTSPTDVLHIDFGVLMTLTRAHYDDMRA